MNSMVVREGMELLSWDCIHASWEEHIVSERLARPREFADSVALAMIGATMTTAVVGALLGPLLTLAVVGGGFAALLGLLVAEGVRGRRRDRDPPRVQFTSTGILVDEQGWLWRGAHHWLDQRHPPRVVPGFEDSAPCIVELTFARRLGRRVRLRIPIPSSLLNDAHGLVQHLRDRLDGREAHTIRSPRPSG